MDIKEQKKEIRKHISALIKQVSFEYKVELSEVILDKIENMDLFKNSEVILLYYALPDEVQTEAFINKWCGKKRIVLPVVDGDNLILKEYRPDMISVGYQSIMEPTNDDLISPCDIELAIIPGVAFDASKNRLGRGKGFYDRLLPDMNCSVIGLGYGLQIVESIPVESFDRSLDLVVTEKRIFGTI